MSDQTSVSLRLNNVRMAYASLFEKDKYKRYSVTFLLDPECVYGEENIKNIKAALTTVQEGKWKGKKVNLKHCCYGQDDDRGAGFNGMMYIGATNKHQPPLRDLTPSILLTEDDDKIYSGAYVNATIDIYAWDMEGSKQINCTVTGVQFRAHGERFSGSKMSGEEAFEQLGELDEQDDSMFG